MNPTGYFIFHLNLAFSSIEKHSWSTVVDKCYWPLLDIISELEVPLGIELPAWTLKGIQETSPEWVSKFRQLLQDGKCELIGSGYCQIIAPLVPYEVNVANQKIGLEIYDSLLGVKPAIALVNEMAFSDAVVDILSDAGYSGFIMDRDNIQLALGDGVKSLTPRSGFAKGAGGSELPVLWGDSILFQKLQHISHGNISIDDYLAFIEKRLSEGETLFPLYCNDAETFDFRPGRFKEEALANVAGEWVIIRKVMQTLQSDLNFEYVLPSKALMVQNSSSSGKAIMLTSAEYPIPVKKQEKYNIARWSVTGRDDTWINTMCYRIYNKLMPFEYIDYEKWINLCELWASDLRTHLTEQRWVETKDKINDTLKSLDLSPDYGMSDEQRHEYSDVIGLENLGDFSCCLSDDRIYLSLENKHIKIKLNQRRGLCIESLVFASHGGIPCVGKIPHGYLDSIVQGVDYYSGGVVIEIPESRIKVTDLHPVDTTYAIGEGGDLTLRVVMETQIGTIIKFYEISNSKEQIKISYKMTDIKRAVSSARLGNLTLSPEFSRSFKSYSCHNGGSVATNFKVTRQISHSQPASRFVSSSRGFSATSGELCLEFAENRLYMSFDSSECSPLCFIDHDRDFTRLSFSVSEIDETSRQSERYGDFEVSISSSGTAT